MTSRPEARTVGFFEQLYAVVLALGLALAVEQVIDLSRSGVPVVWRDVPLFLAYVNLAFPLAHASVRYLDLAYVDRELGTLGRARILGDLALGTGHFLLLIACPLLVTRAIPFGVAAAVLLAGRPTRDLIVRMTGNRTLAFDDRVATIQVGAAIAVGAVVAVASLADLDVWFARIGILAATYVFAIGVYLYALPFFFPTRERKTGG